MRKAKACELRPGDMVRTFDDDAAFGHWFVLWNCDGTLGYLNGDNELVHAHGDEWSWNDFEWVYTVENDW